MFLEWPLSLRATPMVSRSQMTTVPSTRPEARKSPFRLNRTHVECPDRMVLVMFGVVLEQVIV